MGVVGVITAFNFPAAVWSWNMAIALVFAAVGTAGQRCTSLRRVIAHESIVDALMERITRRYQNLRVGNPFNQSTHLGPVISPHRTFSRHGSALQALRQPTRARKSCTPQRGPVPRHRVEVSDQTPQRSKVQNER